MATVDTTPSLGDLASLFATIGAFTFGGGLTMIALMQEHVVDRLHWLTPREFVDGLALGQLTPGPVLMLAAYVGDKVLGVSGALVAATASFLPSFILMLGLLPVFERIRDLRWAKAAMQGLIPGVIVMAIALVRMAPHAAPDPPAVAALVVTATALLVWRLTRPTTPELLKYFLYLGSLGFGGPVALVGYMQRDLVEQRPWFTKDGYMKSLALSQLAVGLVIFSLR